MYTPQELETHRGWGHSTFVEAVAVAAEAGAHRLVLFPHEPEHGDAAIDDMLTQAPRPAEAEGFPPQGPAAPEGGNLNLLRGGRAKRSRSLCAPFPCGAP